MRRSSVYLLCVAALFCGLTSVASTYVTSGAPEYSSALLGEEECLDGPSYWCQNFTTARQCNANVHCIRTVWEHQVLPPDNGNICDTCKTMVAQARDELKSNETQENIKLVLEGSCMILIPIKPLAHECKNIVDEFIPQLIEALSSQMDPQMVCSVAGLCNSAAMDALVAKYTAQAQAEIDSRKPELNCKNCAAVIGKMEHRFRGASRDHVLDLMLEICGQMGSFSDMCSASVIVHFNNLYEEIANSFEPDGVCHLAGVCSQKYHNHSKQVEVQPMVELNDDTTCEFCEQLVKHVKDILIANTTEKEFERVLLGICGQTKGFKKECVDLVETYYPVIYAFLTEELDGKKLCTQISLCPKSGSVISPLYPLLPVDVATKLEKDSSTGLHRVPLSSGGVSVHSAQDSLPLDSMIVLPQSKEMCDMCEYFLHFLQTELTDPVNEQVLINKAQLACNELPQQFAPACRSFVDAYATAVISLLAQDIDPSQVCPRIGVCPGYTQTNDICTPCRATATHLLSSVGSNSTEANAKKHVMSMCMTMPLDSSRHCNHLVYRHWEDFIDMVVAEFTSDEMCLYLKYCPTTELQHVQAAPLFVGGDVETNEIPKALTDEKLGGDKCEICKVVMKKIEKELKGKSETEIRNLLKHGCQLLPLPLRHECKKFMDKYSDVIVSLLLKSVAPDQICEKIGVCKKNEIPKALTEEKLGGDVCEFCKVIMKKLEKMLEDKKTEEEIREALEHICVVTPSTLRPKCKKFVDEYSDLIVTLLAQSIAPEQICEMIGVCSTYLDGHFTYIRKSLSKCVVCESLMGALQGVIDDPQIDKDINYQLRLACGHLPQNMHRECQDIVEQLAPQIETIIKEVPIGPIVCSRLQLCTLHSQTVDIVTTDRCLEGPSYWCASTMHAAACEKIEFCQKTTWLSDKPGKKTKMHAKKFVF